MKKINPKKENKNLNFGDEELESFYKVVREYYENTPDNSEDYYYGDYYNEPINKKIVKSILDKTGKVLPQRSKELIDKDFLRKKYDIFNNAVEEKVWLTVNKAFQQLRTVEIEYFNMENAEFKKRKINIYHKSSKYIVAYCHLRKDMRKFRMSRINSAKLTNNKYKIPKNFDKNDY